jgi:outer membrane protein assembly factor BamB
MDLVLGSDGLYVGCSGNTYVVKYDLNGDKLWSTPLRGPGIRYMYLIDDQLQVSTSLDELVGLNTSDGKGTLLHSDDQIVIFSTLAVSYVDLNGLRAVDNNTKTVLWNTEWDGLFWLAPVFLADVILFRTGIEMGRIYGIDRASGATLWRTDENIISNIAYSPTKATVYALSRDGQLLAINPISGEQSILAEFSSVPFILDGEVGGYELAFDDTTQLLYVLLGDSRQLFAFQIR